MLTALYISFKRSLSRAGHNYRLRVKLEPDPVCTSSIPFDCQESDSSYHQPGTTLELLTWNLPWKICKFTLKFRQLIFDYFSSSTLSIPYIKSLFALR